MNYKKLIVYTVRILLLVIIAFSIIKISRYSSASCLLEYTDRLCDTMYSIVMYFALVVLAAYSFLCSVLCFDDRN